jgi:tRNA A-37 threonylcarbamoyl transferase component Bud32
MEILSKWKARLKILPITETKSQSYVSITGNCSKINENTPNNANWYLLDNENNKALQQGKNLLKKLPNKGKFDINFQILQDDQCKFIWDIKGIDASIMTANGEFSLYNDRVTFNKKSGYLTHIKFYLNETELALLNEVELISDENDQILSDQPAEIERVETADNLKSTEIEVAELLASLALTDAETQKREKVDANEVEFEDVVGVGGFSKIWKANYNDSVVAVKQYNNKQTLESIENEARILSLAKHVNIVQFIDFQAELKLLFMEYCPKGSLYDILHVQNQSGRRRAKNSVPDPNLEFIKHRATVIKDIISGLLYIHETVKVIHLDFNSKNILLTNDWRVRICDFGLSMFISELNDPDVYQRKRGAGGITSQAPEMLRIKSRDIEEFSFNEKVDIYGFGLIMWEIFHPGQNIWEGLHDTNHIRKAIADGKRPKIYSATCPKPYQQLIEKCWDKDPKNRPTAHELHSLIFSIP